MPFGVPDISFEGIEFPIGQGDMVIGTVRLTIDDEIESGFVTHHVTAKVRITVRKSASVEELNSSLLAAAALQLRRALERIEGKTAQELVNEATAKLRSDQPQLEPPMASQISPSSPDP